MLPWSFLWGILYVLNRRQVDTLHAQGIRPSFWERHFFLPLFLGLLAVVPFGLYGLPAIVHLIVWWMSTSMHLDKALGATGVVALVFFTSPAWIPMLMVFIRAEWPEAYDKATRPAPLVWGTIALIPCVGLIGFMLWWAFTVL